MKQDNVDWHIRGAFPNEKLCPTNANVLLPPAPWHVLQCDLSALREQLGQESKAQERWPGMGPTAGDPAGRPPFPLLAEESE